MQYSFSPELVISLQVIGLLVEQRNCNVHRCYSCDEMPLKLGIFWLLISFSVLILYPGIYGCLDANNIKVPSQVTYCLSLSSLLLSILLLLMISYVEINSVIDSDFRVIASTVSQLASTVSQ